MTTTETPTPPMPDPQMPPARQPQIDDEPAGPAEAAAEAQQIQQALMVLGNQVQQLQARMLFLDGWQRGSANRENRRAAVSATRAAKKTPSATKKRTGKSASS